MFNHDQIIVALRELNDALQTNHPESQTAAYLQSSLAKLQNARGATFADTFQQLLNQISMVMITDGLTLTPREVAALAAVRKLHPSGHRL
ncbi:hypothetical protein [Lacticaseibacillus pantheris]